MTESDPQAQKFNPEVEINYEPFLKRNIIELSKPSKKYNDRRLRQLGNLCALYFLGLNADANIGKVVRTLNEWLDGGNVAAPGFFDEARIGSQLRRFRADGEGKAVSVKSASDCARRFLKWKITEIKFPSTATLNEAPIVEIVPEEKMHHFVYGKNGEYYKGLSNLVSNGFLELPNARIPIEIAEALFQQFWELSGEKYFQFWKDRKSWVRHAMILEWNKKLLQPTINSDKLDAVEIVKKDDYTPNPERTKRLLDILMNPRIYFSEKIKEAMGEISASMNSRYDFETQNLWADMEKFVQDRLLQDWNDEQIIEGLRTNFQQLTTR